jgi:hypothetical protein
MTPPPTTVASSQRIGEKQKENLHGPTLDPERSWGRKLIKIICPENRKIAFSALD